MMNRKLFAITTVVLMMFAGIGLFATNSDESEAANSTHNITVAQGQNWSYDVTINLPNPSYSISESATSWVSLSGNTVSGTVPAVGSSATTLVITASTTYPTQSYTQTINFTISEGLGLELGPNVNGVLNLSTKVLTVTGTGSTYEFGASGNPSETPLADYLNSIETIYIGDGVTRIGQYFGSNVEAPYDIPYLPRVKTISGGSDIVSIGDSAFAGLGTTSSAGGTTIAWLDLESLTTIESFAFWGADLNGIVIPDNVNTIEEYAFKYTSWTNVAFGNGLSNFSDSAFTIWNGEMELVYMFYQADGSTRVSGNNVAGKVFYSLGGSNVATNVLESWGYNTHTAHSDAYMVSGKSPSTVAEDKVTYNLRVNDLNDEYSYDDNVQAILDAATAANKSWSLSTTVGSLTAVSSSTSTGTLSGTAPTISGSEISEELSTNVYATYTYTDGASITIAWDDMWTTIHLVAELQFTSVPE